MQGVPHLRGFHYPGSHYPGFLLMYMQVGDFSISRVPLMQILRNTVFSSPKIRIRRGTSVQYVILMVLMFDI